MSFGKRVGGILAAAAALVLIAALVWYVSSALGDKGYEKDGTLVWEEQVQEEKAYPAFVTDPSFGLYGEQEVSRSGKGV